LYAAVLLFWLRVYDNLIVILLPCAVAGPGVCSCVLACCVRLVFQLLGGFFGSGFSLPAWCGWVFFCCFGCASLAHVFVFLFWPRAFVRLAQSRRE